MRNKLHFEISITLKLLLAFLLQLCPVDEVWRGGECCYSGAKVTHRWCSWEWRPRRCWPRCGQVDPSTCRSSRRPPRSPPRPSGLLSRGTPSLARSSPRPLAPANRTALIENKLVKYNTTSHLNLWRRTASASCISSVILLLVHPLKRQRNSRGPHILERRINIHVKRSVRFVE